MVDGVSAAVNTAAQADVPANKTHVRRVVYPPNWDVPLKQEKVDIFDKANWSVAKQSTTPKSKQGRTPSVGNTQASPQAHPLPETALPAPDPAPEPTHATAEPIAKVEVEAKEPAVEARNHEQNNADPIPPKIEAPSDLTNYPPISPQEQLAPKAKGRAKAQAKAKAKAEAKSKAAAKPKSKAKAKAKSKAKTPEAEAVETNENNNEAEEDEEKNEEEDKEEESNEVAAEEPKVTRARKSKATGSGSKPKGKGPKGKGKDTAEGEEEAKKNGKGKNKQKGKGKDGKDEQKEKGKKAKKDQDKEDAALTRKKLLSRKSSAYHAAMKKARTEGVSEEVAKQRAKEATGLHNCAIAHACVHMAVRASATLASEIA